MQRVYVQYIPLAGEYNEYGFDAIQLLANIKRFRFQQMIQNVNNILEILQVNTVSKSAE